MGTVLDIILVAIAVLCIVLGVKRGFFKSVASLASGIVSLLAAYTFTPTLSVFIKDKFILGALSDGIFSTLASIAESGVNAVGETVYDLTKLSENDQFLSIVDRYGADRGAVDALIDKAEVGGKEILGGVADTLAAPIAETLSNVIAFIVIFTVSMIALRIVIWLAGLLFRLPVLKEADKIMGLVFGVLCAVLFVQIFASIASSAVTVLSKAYPSTFSEGALENSHLLKFFAKYNFVGALFNSGIIK